MANKIDGMVIELQLETANMKRELALVKGQLAGLGTASVGASGGVAALAGGFTKMLGAAGLVIGLAGAVSFLASATKSAAEENEQITILHTTLKNVTGASPALVASIDAQIDAMAKMSGVVDDEIRPSFEILVRATGSTTEAMKLQKLALDVAAGTGKDLTTVSAALAKAHDGNKGALARLVPGIKGAADQMGFLTKNFDGAAKAAADANPYKRMEETVDGLKETIGGAFLPIVQQLADMFVKISPLITMVSKVIADVVAAIMPFVDQLMNALMPILTPLLQVVMSLVKIALTPLMIAFKILMIPVELFAKRLEMLITFLGPVFEIMAQTSALISGAFDKAWKSLTKVIQPLVDIFKKQLGPQMSGVKDIMGQVGRVMTGFFSQGITFLLGALVKLISGGIKLLVSWLGALQKGARDAAAWLQNNFGAAIRKVSDFLKPFIDGLKTAWSYISKISGASSDVFTSRGSADQLERQATASENAPKAPGGGGAGGGGGGGAAAVVDHAAIIAKANKTFHNAIKAVQKQFHADSLALLTSHNDAVAGIMAQGAAKLAGLIEQSKGLLTSAFKSATAIDAGSMFLNAGGSVTNFLAMMKEKLAGAKALADNAAKLSGLGYSQEFIQSIIAQGPDVGSALAGQLIAAGPEQAAAMQEALQQVNAVSNHGVDDLASQINASGNLATEELRNQFAAAQNDLVSALAAENQAYARSVDQLERAVATSMAKLKITRDKALRDQYKAMGTAAGNRSAAAMTQDIAAQNEIIRQNAQPNVTNINTVVTAQTNASAASIAAAVIAEIKFGAPVIVKAA